MRSLFTLIGFKEFNEDLSQTMTSIVFNARQAGLDIVNELNQIWIKNQNVFIQDAEQTSLKILNQIDITLSKQINNTKTTFMELLSETNNQIEENALKIIQIMDKVLKNNIELAVKHTENATMMMVNQTLEIISTNEPLKFMSIFYIFISLIIVSYFLFKHSYFLERGGEILQTISKGILFIAIQLLFISYILALWWFFQSAIRKINFFYIGGFIMLLSGIIPIFELIHHKINSQYKDIDNQNIKQQIFPNNEHEYSL